jgi:hypothetical protein
MKNNQIILKGLYSLALLLLMLSFTTDEVLPLVNNEYRVEIDNCHSDIENEGTGGTITAEFWSGNRNLSTKTKTGLGVYCGIEDIVFSTSVLAHQNVTHVVLRTNTGDAFYIDELRLFKNGSLNKHYGSDDGSGWCLSTDKEDANTAWKGRVVGCNTSWRFDYNNPGASVNSIANGINYGSKISLKSYHGKYLVSEHNGNLNANRDAARSLEQFTVINATNSSDKGIVKFGDKVFLQGSTGKYLVGEHDGTANANRDRAASLETFYILNPKNLNARNTINTKTEKVCFKTLHNKFLVAESNGVVNANRGAASIWETWSINAPASGVVSKPRTLVLKRVSCIRPATGIERDINETIGTIADGAGMVLGAIPTRPGKVGLILKTAKLTTDLVGLGTTITTLIDSDRAADNLYILINGRRVWPSSNGNRDVKGGQEIDVNLTMGKGYGTYSVELKEYDWGSDDDSFGRLPIKYDKNTADKFAVLYEDKTEDASYVLWFVLR